MIALTARINDDLRHADYLAEKELDQFAGANEPKSSTKRREYKRQEHKEHKAHWNDYKKKKKEVVSHD